LKDEDEPAVSAASKSRGTEEPLSRLEPGICPDDTEGTTTSRTDDQRTTEDVEGPAAISTTDVVLADQDAAEDADHHGAEEDAASTRTDEVLPTLEMVTGIIHLL
jgi:hypothetical protein